jgi:acyl carrier protein
MHDAQDIRSRIKKLIVERLFLEGLDPKEIGDDDALFGEGLGLDSVDALELVLGLEQEFDIKIKSQEVGREAFASVAALATYVGGRLEEGQAVEG